eukprot:scaffold222741_cov16-Prasinocladus_malaysianus.AAC.1
MFRIRSHTPQAYGCWTKQQTTGTSKILGQMTKCRATGDRTVRWTKARMSRDGTTHNHSQMFYTHCYKAGFRSYILDHSKYRWLYEWLLIPLYFFDTSEAGIRQADV